VSGVNDEAEELGLRERKKRATREALSRAALRLALEHGLDNVRVEAIAAAAGVSPRTFNNYFSSREQAICALRVERAERIAEALRDRPVGEPLAEAIVHAVVEQQAGNAEPDKEMIRLMTSTPALRGEVFKHVRGIEGPLAEAIAERTGLDPERDLGPRVVAAAVFSAIRIATEHWLRPDTNAPLAAVVHDALTWIVPAAEALERYAAPTPRPPVSPALRSSPRRASLC
jgi:AcrR family transcriptional regulator